MHFLEDLREMWPEVHCLTETSDYIPLLFPVLFPHD